MSLKQKTISGFIWSLLERFGVQATLAIVQIILARLIDVEYFGVIATVSILLQILAVIVDGGLGAALIQHKSIDRTDISTVFYFNLVSSGLLFLAVYLSRDVIAGYFKSPLLADITPWLAVGAILAAIGQVQIQMMTRNLNFRRLAIISMPSTLLGGGVGVGLAMLDFQVWALVWMRLSTLFTNSIFAWIFCPRTYQPNFLFSWNSLKRLSGLSLGVLGSNLIMKVTRNLIELIIARVYGARDLGFYSRARFFQKVPTEPLLAILNRVLFPVFSTIQDDNEKIKQSLRQGIPLLMFLVCPLMLWMIVVAKPLVIVLLTDKWLETVPYLRLAPLIGITFALSAIKSNVIKSKGDGRTIFLLSLLRNGLSIAVLFCTWRYGILAMLIGQIACYALNMVINEIATFRYIGYSVWEQQRDYLPTLGCALLAGISTFPLNNFSLGHPIYDLLIQSVLFWTVFLIVSAMFRMPGFTKSQQLLRAVGSGRASDAIARFRERTSKSL